MDRSTPDISCLYVWLSFLFAIILILNTVTFVIGLIILPYSLPNHEGGSVQLVFVILRGTAILCADLFSFLALRTLKPKNFWVAFASSTLSLIWSVLNSALGVTGMSRLDLYFDVLSFVFLVLLTREVIVYNNRQTRGPIDRPPPPYEDKEVHLAVLSISQGVAEDHQTL